MILEPHRIRGRTAKYGILSAKSANQQPFESPRLVPEPLPAQLNIFSLFAADFPLT